MRLGIMVRMMLVVFCSTSLVAKEIACDARPNIIFILADDMGFSDLGCYGGEIATPNLDRLASNGLRFTQMHNTSKCFPSRACLLTGLYAQQCGMDKKHGNMVNAVTLGELLRAAGYRTLASGKHHGTESLYDRGFDRYYGLRDGCCNHFNPGQPRPNEGKPAQKRDNRAWCIDNKTFIPYSPKDKDFYSTDYFTNYALSYLENYRDEDKPFFLYLAYTAPHDPLMAWPDDIAKYNGVYEVGYETVRTARYKRQQSMGLLDKTFPLSAPTYQDWDALSEEDKKDQARRMQVYAAMIDRMDQNIGRVLERLDALDKLDNTLILFASDNGCSAETVKIGTGPIGSMTRWSSLGQHWANVSNTPFRLYKNNSYEGGICTPFIVHWPGIVKNKGTVIDQPCHFIDIMPTLADIAAADYPDTYKGKKITPAAGQSLLALFKDQPWSRNTPLFWQWRRGRAVRDGKYKLVVEGHKQPWQLYDMSVDKTETKNLADQMPERVKTIDLLFENWANSHCQN